MKMIALAFSCALSLVFGSCSGPSVAIGNWELDRAATKANHEANPASRRAIYPRIDLLSWSLDVAHDGTFTETSRLEGSSLTKGEGTWTESRGKIKLTVGSDVTRTATVAGGKMVLVDEASTSDNWHFTHVFRKR